MANLKLLYYRYHKETQVKAILPSVIPYYDLTMVLEGRLEYKVNNRRFTVEENGVILMPPGSRRERLQTTGETAYVSFNFLTDEVIDIPLLLEKGVGKEIRMMVYACREIDIEHSEHARASFESLADAILHALRAYVTRSGNSALTENILSYIRENYKHPLTLFKIAGAMNYSIVYCDQVFKKDMGVSIIRYLIDYRIAKVKEYLIENVMSLREIAGKTGFGESNYLSRQFRQRTGMSPLRFRKEFNR